MIEHTVKMNAPLPREMGNRIEIHVASATKAEARELIEKYRLQAQPSGQVSVRKPCSMGYLMPFAVDNLDGQGVTFNDEWFR